MNRKVHYFLFRIFRCKIRNLTIFWLTTSSISKKKLETLETKLEMKKLKGLSNLPEVLSKNWKWLKKAKKLLSGKTRSFCELFRIRKDRLMNLKEIKQSKSTSSDKIVEIFINKTITLISFFQNTSRKLLIRMPWLAVLSVIMMLN